ncbi:MAG TPA: DUF1476 domain-containing protein [Dongiaceae bacterium]|jgi:hypothetical protein|nr:DUF1476 domain-containing protein [Dongiaceae bacterium]
MTSFDEREQGYENKFSHDKELEFRILARRNKKLGAWAAELLGLTGEAQQAFARDLAVTDTLHQDDDALVQRLYKDFQLHKVEMDERRIARKIGEFHAQARGEVLNKS